MTSLNVPFLVDCDGEKSPWKDEALYDVGDDLMMRRSIGNCLVRISLASSPFRTR